MKFTQNDQRESLWYVSYFLIFFLPLLCLTPFFLGYGLHADLYFTGYLDPTHDQNIYYGFMKQAQDGYLRFLNLPSAVPHDREYIQVLYLLIGQASRLFGVPLDVLYLLAKYLLALAFGFTFYKMLKEVVKDGELVALGMLVVLWGGGLGGLRVLLALIRGEDLIGWTADYFSSDLWIFEMNVWSSIYYTPLFVMSHWLILLVYGAVYRGEMTNRLLPFVIASLAILAIGLSHSYHLVPIFFILPVLFLLFRFDARKPVTRTLIMGYSLFGLFFCIGLFYQYYVLTFNPGFRLWKNQNITLTPDFMYVLKGYGVLTLGFVEVFLRFRRFRDLPLVEKFIGIWAIMQLLLLYSPFAFARRFILGLAIPLTVYFVLFLHRLLERRQAIIAGAMVCVVLSTPIAKWMTGVAKVLRADPRYFYTQDELAAYRSLNGGLASSNVVLSTLEESNRLLRFSPAAMVLASFHQTPGKIRPHVARLFFGEAGGLEDFLEQNSVNYIFLNKRMHARFLAKFGAYLSTKPVHFENQSFVVYKLGESGNVQE